jgi:hypothetical protein
MREPSITDVVLDKISSRVGASSETLQKVKFGRGTVGKIAIIAVFSLGAISVATFHLAGTQALIGIGALVLITLAVLALILYVVIFRPELAVLEGAELVMYKQVTLGMKETPHIPSARPILPVADITPLLHDAQSEES